MTFSGLFALRHSPLKGRSVFKISLIGGIFCFASWSPDLLSFVERWNLQQSETFLTASIGWSTGFIHRAAALVRGGFTGGMRNISAPAAGHRFNWFPIRCAMFAAGRFPMPAAMITPAVFVLSAHRASLPRAPGPATRVKSKRRIRCAKWCRNINTAVKYRWESRWAG